MLECHFSHLSSSDFLYPSELKRKTISLKVKSFVKISLILV
ncbi:hypothetical protein HMPREF3214_00761 [Alloscardovia omnicolens]|nr:hypothetical protein HMPREF3214_00761 [Alloscardovia omnicolens]